jgi:hypothetical protein
MQGSEELKRVPQFLAALAQVVQGFGGRVRGDHRAAPGDLGKGHPGSLRGEQADGLPRGFVRLPGTRSAYPYRPGTVLLDLDEPGAPLAGERREPRGAQAPGQDTELLAPPLLQVGAERLQVVWLRRGEAARGLLVVKQVHVQVPGRRRQVTDPLELGGEERDLFAGQAGERVTEHLQRAPGPPHADPQVVQELRVDVGEHARHVRFDGVEQAQQDGRRRHRARHARGEVRVDLVRVIARTPAEGAKRVGEQELGGRPDAGNGGQQPGGAAGLARIAAHLGDRQPGRERHRPLRARYLARLRAEQARSLDEQPGDGLAVLVHQPVPGGLGAGGDDWDERARRDEAGHAVADLAPRQRGEQVRPGRLPARHQLGGVLAWAGFWARAGQAQFAAAASGNVLQGQPGLVQPPVEGVEPGRPADAARRGSATALRGHVELRRERRERRCRGVIPRLRIAAVGNETCQHRGQRNSSSGDASLFIDLSINSPESDN